MTTISRLLAALLLSLVLGLSAACGSSSGDDDGSTLPDAAGASSDTAFSDDDADLDPEDATLKFAQCMREHGVDMAVPEPGGGVMVNGEGIPKEQMEAAETAYHAALDEMGADAIGELKAWPKRVKAVTQEKFSYQVRGRSPLTTSTTGSFSRNVTPSSWR